MPTIEENKRVWNTTYNWEQQGNEWSSDSGGVEMQWRNIILPRIQEFLPAKTVLEIAPGFGRWTEYLKDLCENLILVDLAEKCIQACKSRFSSCSHITYHVNDGKSLDMIPDGSIDFVFSFDSLVHAEDDVLKAYINQLSKKLTKDGVGCIHHSNLGEYAAYYSLLRKIPRGRGLLVRLGLIELDHWRAISMTASKFEQYAEEAGLQCISQDIIKWGTKRRLIDCISTFTRKDSVWSRPNKVTRENQ